MFALGDAWLGDVDADLTTVEGVDELSEGASVVNIHLEVEECLLFWEIAQEGGIETLGEGVGRNLGNHEGLGHLGKLMEEVNDVTKGCLVCHGTVAVTSFGRWDDVKTFEF